jgi:hypothetical protein
MFLILLNIGGLGFARMYMYMQERASTGNGLDLEVKYGLSIFLLLYAL